MQGHGVRSGVGAIRTAATHTLTSKSRHPRSHPHQVSGSGQSHTRSPVAQAGTSYGRHPPNSTRPRPGTVYPTASTGSELMRLPDSYGLTPRPPRYPNYLPEMRARRAVINRRSNFRTVGSSSTTQSLMEEVNETILRDLLKLNDSRVPLPVMLPRKSLDAAGHAYCDPPPQVSRHYPKIIMSLYRSPTRKILDWEVGSPTVQLDNMRNGEAVGPTPSQLPTPDSSHAVCLSMRGRNRTHRDLRKAQIGKRTKN